MREYTDEEVEKINKDFENKLMARREKYSMTHDWLEDYFSYFPDGDLHLTRNEFMQLIREYDSLMNSYQLALDFPYQPYEQDTIYG
jgi:hypothetical protein